MKAAVSASSTPDSVPSLSEVTRASGDTDNVSRVLFDSQGGEEYEVLNKHLDKDPDKDSLAASDFSVASLTSLADTVGDAGLSPTPSCSSALPGIESPCLSSPLELSHLVDDVAELGTTTEHPSSCHGGLNVTSARQLVGNVFNLFDGSQGQWRVKASSVVSDGAETTVTSNTSNAGSKTVKLSPRSESLERECSTLKEIIKVDSVTILKLKTSLEKVRHDAAKQQHEIESMKKERDLLREREKENLETVTILKKEVDALTQIGAASSPETHKELEQLRIENELFATQIIENEVEMREIRSVVEFLDSENSQMRKELQSVQGKLAKERDGEREEGEAKEGDLKQQVEFLAKRLDKVESERDQANRMMEEKSRKRDEELESIKKMISFDSLSKALESRIREVSAFKEEIEVTLDQAPLETSADDKEKDLNVTKEKNPGGKKWNLLCDCFPSSDSDEERT